MTAPTPASAKVTLPGVGPVNRTYVIVGGVLVVGLVYFLYRRKAASGTAVTGVNTSTGTAALPDTGYINPVPVAGPPSGPIAGGAATDNSTWSQNAVSAMVAAGWDAQFAATTIGRYLSGQPLSQPEQDAVRAAYAVAGYPPQMLPIIPEGATGPANAPAPSGQTIGWFGRNVNATTYTSQAGDTLQSIHDKFQPINPDTNAPAGVDNVTLANGGLDWITSVTGQSLPNVGAYANVPLPAGTTVTIPSK